MTTPTIPDVDLLVWQRRAVKLLDRLLVRHIDLPLPAWTISSARCEIHGYLPPYRPEAATRVAHAAWVAALGLTEHPERETESGTLLLRATGRIEHVYIAVTATVEAEDRP